MEFVIDASTNLFTDLIDVDQVGYEGRSNSTACRFLW